MNAVRADGVIYHRVAQKALEGQFGQLDDWQIKGYTLLLQHGPAQEGRAYVTHYTPHEGYSRGEATAYGWACQEGCWAANSLPAYWYVLVQAPNGFWELGWIRDNGADWNDAHWKRKARDVYGVEIDLWLDRWTPRAGLTNVSWPTARYYAISADKTW